MMQTDIPAEKSAAEYEKVLHEYFPKTSATTFDLVFLGMGDDGHTLSLFQGGDLVNEKVKWVAAPWVPAQNMFRITLTAVVVNMSACIAFLAIGENKAAPLEQVLEGDFNPTKYPSQIIKPVGQLHWFVDEDAAEKLTIQ